MVAPAIGGDYFKSMRQQVIDHGPRGATCAWPRSSSSATANTRLRDYLMKSAVRGGKKVVVPRSLNQRVYLEQIETHDMVFGIGPAGTGKTYLAVAQAVQRLVNKKVARIVLARPAVEAGEKLGFLPGDLQDKVDPYLRPLYDALYDLLDYEKVARLIERNAIEVAPIAFMRGRTLNDAFVIIDEAQNTTTEQMKMVLTRIGFGSKVVVTGDITQIDLPAGRTSGLVEAISVLGQVKGIAFSYFDEKDVVRHKLVQAIVKAYEAYGADKAAQGEVRTMLEVVLLNRQRRRGFGLPACAGCCKAPRAPCASTARWPSCSRATAPCAGSTPATGARTSPPTCSPSRERRRRPGGHRDQRGDGGAQRAAPRPHAAAGAGRAGPPWLPPRAGLRPRDRRRRPWTGWSAGCAGGSWDAPHRREDDDRVPDRPLALPDRGLHLPGRGGGRLLPHQAPAARPPRPREPAGGARERYLEDPPPC